MEKQHRPHLNPRTIRTILLIFCDLILINMAYFAALFTRFEFSWTLTVTSGMLKPVVHYVPVNMAGTLTLFCLFRLYSSLWEYAGADETLRIIFASACSGLQLICGTFVLNVPIPRSFPVIYAMYLALVVGGLRFTYRSLRKRRQLSARPSQKRTMLIGGGAAGATALLEFQRSEKSENHVVCIIDDDSAKRGQLMRGVPIVGGRDTIQTMADKYKIQEIVLAIPSASYSQRQELLNLCKDTKCTLKSLPGLFQLANGEVSIEKIRRVEIEDLLGRDAVRVDLTGIGRHVGGKVVLVTGGGGSIGSELCRQLASFSPSHLIILDVYENNAYEIQQELLRKHPDLRLTVLIGSVRDVDRIDSIFATYRPNLVYHAAAHKHVPLMEVSPCEAIKNNVFGTLNVARAASQYGADRMLLISTDKAVNPSSIMGASKRICEMIVQMVGRQSPHTEYVAVRFGNVLGSNGSVIPLFRKQIAEGGPVTVTDKNIIRYFMTIPEAVSLVLQAGVYAKGREIFILDMGEPVRIDDLARNMIRLSGFEPDVDIPIVYTGLRPGEKLYEELLLAGEGNTKTDNALIFIAKDQPFDDEKLGSQLQRLWNLCQNNDEGIRDLIHQIVPEFKEPVQS